MEAASTQIRQAIRAVEELRAEAAQSVELSRALHDIKTLQAQRFAATYHDLLNSPAYSGCARFSLTELYSERDYKQRDRQFAKVAGAIAVAFPQPVIATTVDLARLHQITETLDLAMARQWQRDQAPSQAIRYYRAWHALNCPQQRQWQLDTVLRIGRKLGELTRRRSLRLLLKMMRHPAELAGLSDLQTFLEDGFDRFRQIAKADETLIIFLDTIQQREARWITAMDSMSEQEAEKLLNKSLQGTP